MGAGTRVDAMNLGQMLAATYDDLNYSPQPSPDVQVRIARWINEAHQHVLRLPSLTGLRNATFGLTSEDSRGFYGLPQMFERMDAIVQQSNNARLVMRTKDWFRSVDPGENSNGNPYVWVPEGLHPVFRLPDATGIWAASTSAADTTQVVRLLGASSHGDEQAEASATLTGTSRVAIGSVTDYSDVREWSVSSTCAGVVSLYDAASSGNELARIPVGKTSVQYDCIRLWPTPSAALDYTIDGQALIYELVNSDDVPMLPVSYHDMLPCYARFRQYKKSGDSERAAMEQAEWQNWIGRLQSFVEFPSDYRPVAGSINQDTFRWSNLPGGWYPADGWGR